MNNKYKWFIGLFLVIAGLAPVAMAQTKPSEATTLAPKYLNWADEEVNSIITPKEKEVFLKLGTDKERDIFIEAFWKQRDPNPSTPDNEFKIQHYTRIQAADLIFGQPGIPGHKTESGRNYIVTGTGKLPEKDAQSASPWIVKMRAYEVPGKGGGMPVKEVTSSYLNYKLTATISTEYDLAEEMKQIQKTFNYTDVKLLTEADFTWKRNDRDRAFHMFRLDGHEYVVLITPLDVVRRLTFRLEVLEQGDKAKTSLLDTEFSIPERNITVFGFEDTKGNAYFLSFRVTGWSPSAGSAGTGGGATPYVIPAEGPVRAVGEIKPPRLVKQVDPIYPPVARQAGVQGVVILEAETDIYGRIQSIKVLRSIPLLDQAAIDAVRQWVYEPPMINGKPRGVVFTTTVRFTLDGGKSAPPAKDGEPLKITGDVKGPKVIKRVDPVYPEEARKARVEGTVILEATIDVKGQVQNVRILRSIPLLDQAALDAVRQWVYEPPIINGKPIPLTFAVTMSFALDGGKSAVGGVMGGVVGGATGAGLSYTWERDDAKLPAAKDEPKPIKTEGDIKPPKLIKRVEPVNPDTFLKQAGIQGIVNLEVEADAAGKVKRIKSVGSDLFNSVLPYGAGQTAQILIQVAIEAVKQWEYEPFIVDGKPRAVIFTVTVRFNLK